MYKQYLTKGWQIAYTSPLGREATAADMPTEAANWMPIDVPGDINDALHKNGVLPDPHFDENAKEYYFISANEWWYKLVFDIDEICLGKMDMVFEILDGVCDVFYNGEPVMKSTSAFYPHSFNARGKTYAKNNVLAVHFKSIDQCLGSSRYNGQTGWGQRRVFIRKPQFTFGWDWALPVPSLGIAGPVYLIYDCGECIKDVNVDAHTNGRVDFIVEVDELTLEAPFELTFEVEGHGFCEKKVIPARKIQVGTYITIEDPKLWFPNGYGDANVYNYKVTLTVDGVVKDEKSGIFGLRDVEILEEPFTEDAGYGYSFWLKVNGIRIFCKGGNYIPLELWPALSTDEKYRFSVEKAKEANFNMLRVWGGGIYCHDAFYEACDRAGIMVWQDFMFASAGYPLFKMRDDIIAEASYQILRLRNHPCIVLWCGCNEDCFSWVDRSSGAVAAQNDVQAEDDALTGGWYFDRVKYDPELYTMLLRGLVGKYCHGTPYIESSPQSREGAGNQNNSGNAHNSCWKYALFCTDGHYDRFRDHFEHVCSFDSEFCIQGPCSEKYFRSFMDEKNHWPPNDAWVYHVQRGHHNMPHHKQISMIAGATFGEIDSLQKYTKYGQALHLEMMRSEFESARRDYPNNGGTMMWMFMDCWPTSNWAIIDYAGHMKPCFYSAKRACSPVLPIVFERGGKIDFCVSNHSPEKKYIDVRYGIRSLDGTVKTEKYTSVTVDPCANAFFDRFAKEDLACENNEYIFIDATCDAIELDSVSYFANMWKEVPFTPHSADITISDASEENGKYTAHITIKTDNFIRLAHFDSVKEGLVFSDNYFDLPAGKTKTITVTSDKSFSEEDLIFGDWFDDWE